MKHQRFIMKVLKSIGTYLLILCIIVVAIGLILGGYLVLFPEKDLFGIKYAQVHQTYNEQITTSVEDITAINIESGKFNVIVLPSEDENIFTATECMYYGFVQKDNADVDLVSTINAGLLTIKLKEPIGAVLYSTFNLKVYIPYNHLLSSTTLDVNTQKGNIMIGQSSDTDLKLCFGETVLKSQKGSIGLHTSTIYDALTLETTSGDIGIASTFVTNADTLNIKLGDGKANLTNFENLKNINNVKLQITNNATFESGEIKNLEATTFRGTIKLSQIDTLTATTNGTFIDIETVLNNSQITQTGGGSINVANTKSEITINAEKSNIVIAKAEGSTYLKTTSGKIIVSALTFVSAETLSGAVQINYNELEDNVYYTVMKKYRTALINTSSGNIDITGVDFVEINSTKKSNINVDFHDIASEESIITAQEGSIKIITSDNTINEGDSNGTAFRITYTANNVTDVNVHGETTENEANITHSFNIYEENENIVLASKLTINANDCSLWVRDRSLANAE